MTMSTYRVGKVKYNPDKVIGRGNFGTVFRGILRGDIHGADEKPIAVKRVERIRVDESLIQREVELMQKANDHPNILHYFCTEMNNEFIFIATELCIGTLKDYITNNEELYEGPRFESEREMLYQVTQGLAYLHNLGIVHRDIKPTNILIYVPSSEADAGNIDCDSTSNKPQMKLADFGLSKVLQTDKEDFTNTSVADPSGTKGWMPPEVYECNRFDFKVDVWALGCIFGYTLSGGKHPYGNDRRRILRIIRKEAMVLVQEDLKEPYSRGSDIVFELIQSMLEIEPNNRPTAFKVLTSAFFVAVNTSTPLQYCTYESNPGQCVRELEYLICCPSKISWFQRFAEKYAFLPPLETYTFLEEAAGHHKLCLSDRAEWQYSDREKENMEVFYTRTRRTNTIACMFIRCSPSARYTILFSHGRALDLGQMSSFYLKLGTKINCNIFSYDYSGYGMSTGRATEKNLYADIDAAFHALRTRYGISPKNIILYGQCIGTVPTVDLASRHDVGAVILRSPLMSGLGVVFPLTWNLWNFYSIIGINNTVPSIEKVSKVKSPVLVIHGINDEVIDFSHGIAIHVKCPKTVEPLWVEGAGHNDVELHSQYFERLKHFISVELAN